MSGASALAARGAAQSAAPAKLTAAKRVKSYAWKLHEMCMKITPPLSVRSLK